MALGARPSDVRRLVMRDAAGLVVAGLAIGLSGAVALSRLLDRVVFGISPTDAMTYAAVTVGLGLAASAAAQLPAMRATRVDPIKALHES
jgi:putative ABC transport system permease protein